MSDKVGDSEITERCLRMAQCSAPLVWCPNAAAVVVPTYLKYHKSVGCASCSSSVGIYTFLLAHKTTLYTTIGSL